MRARAKLPPRALPEPAASDPIARFKRWLREAERAGARQPDRMALATATRRALPSVRYVLLKGVDARGFVFYTDARSRKGRELADNPHAALAFHWSAVGKQVRIEGAIQAVSDAETDRYWATRPRGSRLSAATSRQSAELLSRAELVARRRALARRVGDGEIDRPAAWRGYRLVPEAIEFWTQKDDRLHHRELFRRAGGGWQVTLLEP